MAQDITEQRRNLARNAVIQSERFADALVALQALQEQRSKLVSDFADADFDGVPDLKQLTAAMLGQLFDFVVPNLTVNYIDTANGGRNKQILLQVRR